jgi:hypothetical protein
MFAIFQEQTRMFPHSKTLRPKSPLAAKAVAGKGRRGKVDRWQRDRY